MINIEKKAIKTKKKIYESAKELFLNKPINDVTVDSIVKKAGVAKGSFYVYFKSKNDLIINFISENTREVDEKYHKFLESLNEDITTSEMLVCFTKEIANILINYINRDSMKIIYKMQLISGLYSEGLMDYNRTLYLLFNNIIQRGIKRGEFKLSDESRDISKDMMISFRGLTFEWLVREKFDLLKEVTEYFTRFVKRIANK